MAHNFKKRYLSITGCVLLSCFFSISLAQSGRNKKDEAKDNKKRPQIISPETEKSGSISKNPAKPSSSSTPTPTPIVAPTPKKDGAEDSGVLEINSFLVPIPVSVTDQKGAPVNDLQLADFELLIDNVKQDISEISRSETPVKIALLFDNSSSVTTARDFELKSRKSVFQARNASRKRSIRTFFGFDLFASRTTFDRQYPPTAQCHRTFSATQRRDRAFRRYHQIRQLFTRKFKRRQTGNYHCFRRR